MCVRTGLPKHPPPEPPYILLIAVAAIETGEYYTNVHYFNIIVMFIL